MKTIKILVLVAIVLGIVICGCSQPTEVSKAYYLKDLPSAGYACCNEIVWEYVGGHIGPHPNRNDIDEFLTDGEDHTRFYPATLVETANETLLVLSREDDGHPMGLVAIETLDGSLVILEGRTQLGALLEDPLFFADPVKSNLPLEIFSLHPEKYDMVMKLREEAGLND